MCAYRYLKLLFWCMVRRQLLGRCSWVCWSAYSFSQLVRGYRLWGFLSFTKWKLHRGTRHKRQCWFVDCHQHRFWFYQHAGLQDGYQHNPGMKNVRRQHLHICKWWLHTTTFFSTLA